MTATLVALTLRQLLSRRRALLIAFLALVPVFVAVIYRVAGERQDPLPVQFAADLVDALVIAFLVPLAALIFGTSALGAEIEDGTAVYLLTKPIARWRIYVTKFAVAAAATLVLVTPSAALAAVVVLGGDDPWRLTLGFAAATALGAVTYCAIFVSLSAFTSRALLVGLAYVFVWEAFVTGIFSGTRWVSVRQYMRGVADGVSSAPTFALDADLSGAGGLVAAVVVLVASCAVGVYLLDRFEVGERL